MNQMVIFSLLLALVVVAIDAWSIAALKRKVRQRSLEAADIEVADSAKADLGVDS